MIALLVAINTIGFMFLYILAFRLIKRTNFYKELVELYEHVARVPSKVKSKGDVRRAKKYRPYLKTLRRKTLYLIALNFGLFAVVYTGMLLSMMFITSTFSVFYVESPVFIPFFSTYDAEHGKVFMHVYVMLLIALAVVTYPISKEMRFYKST